MAWIKANLLMDGNHFETVGFPCSDDEIMRLTEQKEGGHKATVFINNLIDPKGLKSIEGTYANIHELNYLAKRMDSFDVTEMEKLLAAATYFDIRDLKQLINYTFNLHRITLIQNIASMQMVGVEHYLDLNGGGCTNEEFYDPQRAEEGRALLNSKRGIWTDYGLMFINNEVPWEEVYNGMTFPEYLYGGPEESSVAICHGGRTEFVYPPCEQSSIEFALERLGADSLDDCHVQLSCSRFGKPLSELVEHILKNEGLEAFNEVCHAAAKIPEREMSKFTAALLYRACACNSLHYEARHRLHARGCGLRYAAATGACRHPTAPNPRRGRHQAVRRAGGSARFHGRTDRIPRGSAYGSRDRHRAGLCANASAQTEGLSQEAVRPDSVSCDWRNGDVSCWVKPPVP